MKKNNLCYFNNIKFGSDKLNNFFYILIKNTFFHSIMTKKSEIDLFLILLYTLYAM